MTSVISVTSCPYLIQFAQTRDAPAVESAPEKASLALVVNEHHFQPFLHNLRLSQRKNELSQIDLCHTVLRPELAPQRVHHLEVLVLGICCTLLSTVRLAIPLSAALQAFAHRPHYWRRRKESDATSSSNRRGAKYGGKNTTPAFPPPSSTPSRHHSEMCSPHRTGPLPLFRFFLGIASVLAGVPAENNVTHDELQTGRNSFFIERRVKKT